MEDQRILEECPIHEMTNGRSTIKFAVEQQTGCIVGHVIFFDGQSADLPKFLAAMNAKHRVNRLRFQVMRKAFVLTLFDLAAHLKTWDTPRISGYVVDVDFNDA